ncbi:hypothetical protein NE237_029385 [Protea cynaroides]|uniref:Enoyl reductase (ER) domain-containing protein n=1 Tax=Protea cynaroides TaxID=273540 RepID=A0A9Q0GTT2_9MAGN|nr:hypothetical protein NE237_029385 [Protea cynaroides]
MSRQGVTEDCLGWAARDVSGFLSPYTFSRRAVGSDDVSVKITHCGICYGDVVWTRNKLGDSMYPVVPGHEIVGIVKKVGSNVQNFKVGDQVGYCNDFLEIHCVKGPIFTFNSIDVDGTIMKGRYSTLAAPLLCAGVTVYTPMMRHKMNQPGKSLGVIGFGGLGHMAMKFTKAFGLNVTVLSTSISKKEDALNFLGADKFVLSSDQENIKAFGGEVNQLTHSFSISDSTDMYLSLLKIGGVLVVVGAPSEIKFHPASLIMGMKNISGIVTCGTKMTQEMIDFCATNKIYPEIEIIPIQTVNEALERMINSDVKYHFVIDIENSLN